MPPSSASGSSTPWHPGRSSWRVDGVVAAAAEDPGSMMIRTMARYLGTFGEVAVNILMLTAMFACVLSFHNVLTRYQHLDGRRGRPPRAACARPRPAPVAARPLVQTATAGILTIVFALCGLDPLLQVFTCSPASRRSRSRSSWP